MAGCHSVLEAKVVQCEHIFSRLALKSVKVLNLEHIFDQLQLQPWPFLAKPFQVRFVEQVVDFLLVNLKVGAVDCEDFAPAARLLLHQLEKLVDCARYNSFMLSGLNHGGWNALFLSVVVALHRECLATACLAIREDC